MTAISIDPVAWNEGKVLKWRAMATFFDGHRQNAKCRIYGNPEPTKRAAYESLQRECQFYQLTAEQALERLENKFLKPDEPESEAVPGIRSL